MYEFTIDGSPSLEAGCDLADFGYRPPPAPIGVGGEAYRVNKLAILASWIALFAVIAVGAIILTRRRAQSWVSGLVTKGSASR